MLSAKRNTTRRWSVGASCLGTKLAPSQETALLAVPAIWLAPPGKLSGTVVDHQRNRPLRRGGGQDAARPRRVGLRARCDLRPAGAGRDGEQGRERRRPRGCGVLGT